VTRRNAKNEVVNRFGGVVPVSNGVNADARQLTDAALWAGLDLSYAPLRAVRAALTRGDEAGAQAALVAHFRGRRTPLLTRYRTDPHWSDWENGPSLIARADALAEFKVFEEGDVLPVAVGGPGGIDWTAALKRHKVIRRQGGIATLAEAWARTGEARYAEAFQTWMTSHWSACPFVLDPAFHREEFEHFGGKAHAQLDSCYTVFHWADVLDSKLMRTPGILPDSFWFELIRRFWFLSFQFTRFLGCSWRADNHHLMERGTTCYFLGVGYPEFKRACEQEAFGAWTIRKHFDHNLLPDHTGSEACTAYQYRCFIRYAQPDSMARINGRTLLGKVRERKLLDWLEFTGFLAAPDGRLPDTGDGAAPTLHSICEESGAFYRSSVLKGISRALGQEAPVNPAFQAGWDRTPARLPRERSRLYPSVGHLVLRDGWRPDANWLWLGVKNEALYNIHQHWNTFDFALSAQGRRVIGDPISRTYGMPMGVARGYYFSMDAHNTLVIDHDNLKSHEALADAWGLQPSRVTRAATCLEARGGFDFATFRHDGYRPLLHRRDVLFVRGRYFIMTDAITMDFTGFNTVFATEGDIRPHHYRQRLHFEAGVTARPLEGRVGLDARVADGPGVLIIPEPFENLAVVEVPNGYLDALNAEGFRGYRMADITRATMGACMFSTVYYPHDGRTVPEVRVTSLTLRTTPYRDDRHHAILIEDGEFQDVWLVQRDVMRPRPVVVELEKAPMGAENGSQTAGFDARRWEGLKLETDAAVLFLSCRGGRVVKSFRLGGRWVRLNGKKVNVPSSPLKGCKCIIPDRVGK
jgi:hypothetical protein